ncbi:Phosphate ABC transporter, ATP-binding protein [Laribacter hongkongensis HLHK9]|uniref:Phosphate ABC transporter, ATP-binding protein n=1 Tax=Laribacter hongkongensis (strain HLHK9) TaxID=557598 RepID=C1DD94_LARHH|nr:ATP-binding cassette domain-containing protein [Laribacter hongkongensis]ACO75726.1 Phosphate ABC transporter, ATP-binding protein [Laribacter hongkongensis HLHK9]
MTAIECRGLCVTLREQRLLDDISLSVPAGQIAVLTGPSGSGKTTLLRTLNRLLDRDQAEVSGTLHLRVGGRTLAPYDRSTDPVWLRRRVGMVFQTPHLLPGSIADNLLLPLRLVKAGSRAALAGRMEEALRAAHVWDEVAGRLHAPAAQPVGRTTAAPVPGAGAGAGTGHPVAGRADRLARSGLHRGRGAEPEGTARPDHPATGQP